MAMGYEGMARLQMDVIESLALCTGASVPRVRPKMESSAAYGGQIRLPVGEIGIGAPETYDLETYDGSMEVELTEDFFSNQLKPWIFNRQKAGNVFIQTRADGAQSFSTCYWNSINIAASDSSAVSAGLGFVALKRDAYNFGGGYIANKNQDPSVFCGTVPYNVPSPLNSGNSQLSPIPYWNTSVDIAGVDVEFITWTLDISQDVVKFFSCENNANPVEPRFVGVGPMTITFSGDFMFLDSPPNFLIPDYLSALTLTIGNTTLKLEDLELQTDTDAIQSPESLVPIALEYSAYTLVV